ncbi:ABC transporter substrate-binding protein [Pseudoflavonifractor phocaeensis]|uniref:ABC transporter substrate-binding protein n=1 Tax=Pseudoflavonifractor phocaeensis TaxID=1870988 RepID=UPI00195DEE89|nr:ABC transporter substrate-binding protein [Pseudoflavonifractor phocaeensis]MBM6887459.1 carbohydrate ABC transporter substrate-binding protein [Pseudoflavonifractor phocaeensis]
MKKKLIAGILAGSMLAALAGCGGGETDPGAADSPSGSGSGGVIEITIPSYKTGENVGAVFFEPQVERFNQLYEGQYKINLESVPQDGFNDRLKQLAQQNMLPVLVQGGDVDWMANIAFPNGMAYDLSEWLNETPAVKDLLLEDGLEYCTNEDGSIYSLPLATVRPTGFFYNSALWDPQEDLSAMSMDEFLTALGDQKIAFSTAENGWVAALFLTALIAEEDGGVEWLQSGVETKITDFNTPIFINAVARLQELLQNNAAPNSIGAAYADAANSFMSNQAALISNGPWMSTDFAETNSANWSNGFNGADVRASLFPGQVGIANTACFGEWWISASASEEELELAKAFLEFVYSPEELEAFLLAEGGDAPKLEYSDGFKAQQGETQVLADLAADTTEETVFAPCILDMIPASVANSDFGRLLPSLADGTYSPEEFAQWMTDSATAATAE